MKGLFGNCRKLQINNVRNPLAKIVIKNISNSAAGIAAAKIQETNYILYHFSR